MKNKPNLGLPAYLPPSAEFLLWSWLALADKPPYRRKAAIETLTDLDADSRFVDVVLQSGLAGKHVVLLATVLFDERLQKAWASAAKLEKAQGHPLGSIVLKCCFEVFGHITEARIARKRRADDFTRLAGAIDTIIDVIETHEPLKLMGSVAKVDPLDASIYSRALLKLNPDRHLSHHDAGERTVDVLQLLHRLRDNAGIYHRFRDETLQLPADYILDKRQGKGKQEFLRVFIGCLRHHGWPSISGKIVSEILPSFGTVLFSLTKPTDQFVSEDDVRIALAEIVKAETEFYEEFAWLYEPYFKITKTEG